MKTKSEIDALKANWLLDPHWDIEDTPGFEEHRDELVAFADGHRMAAQRAACDGFEDWVGLPDPSLRYDDVKALAEKLDAGANVRSSDADLHVYEIYFDGKQPESQPGDPTYCEILRERIEEADPSLTILCAGEWARLHDYWKEPRHGVRFFRPLRAEQLQRGAHFRVETLDLYNGNARGALLQAEFERRISTLLRDGWKIEAVSTSADAEGNQLYTVTLLQPA